MPQHAKGNVGHIRHHISGPLRGLHGRGRKGEMRDADGRSSPHCRHMLRSYNRGSADNLLHGCCCIPAPYDLPRILRYSGYNEGHEHEQASISIFVSASVCQHQTVARVIVLLAERTYAAGYVFHSFPVLTASILRRSQLTYPPAASNALSDRY